jgi:hypothetical protein
MVWGMSAVRRPRSAPPGARNGRGPSVVSDVRPRPTPPLQVSQAAAAIQSAWEAGVTRQRVSLLLPLIGATDLDDWCAAGLAPGAASTACGALAPTGMPPAKDRNRETPRRRSTRPQRAVPPPRPPRRPGGIRQQFKAAAPLVEALLRALKQVEGLKGPLSAEIWDDGDAGACARCCAYACAHVCACERVSVCVCVSPAGWGAIGPAAARVARRRQPLSRGAEAALGVLRRARCPPYQRSGGLERRQPGGCSACWAA